MMDARFLPFLTNVPVSQPMAEPDMLVRAARSFFQAQTARLLIGLGINPMRSTYFLALSLALLAPCASLAQPASSGRASVTAQPQPLGWEGTVQAGQLPSFTTLTIAPSEAGRAGGTLRLFGRTIPLQSSEADREGIRATALASDGSVITLTGKYDGSRLVGSITLRERTFPFTFHPIPSFPKAATRLEAWDQDLQTLETRFLNADTTFSPAERGLFLEATAAIRADLPQLTDGQIVARMAAAIALSNNAHTRLYLIRNRTRLKRLPVRLWWFSDGLYVVRATREQRALLGCRVDMIDGVTARHARDLVAPLFAGNPSWRDYMSVYTLTSPDMMQAVGIASSIESVGLSLSNCTRARAQLAPLSLVRSDEPVEAWWDLSPRFPSPPGEWVHALPASSPQLPLSLRNYASYWFEHLPDTGMLYFQYNRSEDAPGEGTKAFGERLVQEIRRKKPTSFVLDLRFNTGGNLELSAALMKQLVEETRGLKRFVITGRATFSAGITPALPWRQAGDVMFVGEPVGDDLDFWAEGRNIRLPNSGYDAHFANALHSYSATPCPAGIPCLESNVESLKPHLPVVSSWADYRAGKDVAFEAIRRSLRK
jgi:hypothetical protein